MRAKVKNCLEKTGGIFVCFLDKYEKYIQEIREAMWRHHFYKDFDVATCSLRKMLKHDKEYAYLMQHFVEKYYSKLSKAEYKPERGDGVGVCFGSDGKPFLMYSVGSLYYDLKRNKKG